MEDRHARRRRSRLTKALFAPLLASALVSCGGASKHTASAVSRAPSGAFARSTGTSSSSLTGNGARPFVGRPMSAYEPPTRLRGLQGDGDHDESSWDDGYRAPDNDEDPGLDHQPSDSPEGYRDADDLDSLSVGHPASAADTEAIEAVVRRYYAVAATGNGARACAMMGRSFAEAVPIDYGKFGKSFLHAGKTCAQIADLQFEHSRSQITASIQITVVHQTSPTRAYALFGSSTTPASFIAVEREGGAWKVAALLGRPEP